MKVIFPDEAKEQGILTKKDLQDIVKALRYVPGTTKPIGNYIPTAGRNALADKLDIQMKKFKE